MNPRLVKPLFLLWTAALVGAGSMPGPVAAEAKKRTLSRTEDFIQFTGADVLALVGSEIKDLHLYAQRASGLQLISLQVDKRDAEGRYVFPNEKGRDPNRDGTKLDPNDEIVFLVKDAGDKTPGKPALSYLRGVEIELSDPQNLAKAWVYLLDQPGVETPAPKDYIHHRVENNAEFILSDNYELGEPQGEAYYHWLRLRRPNGEWGENLFRTQQYGIKARLLNGAIPLHVPAQDIKSVLLGVIDGPVRVIRDELDMVKLKNFNFEWSTEYFLTYYPNGHLSPSNLNFPFTANKVFLDISYYWALDFTPAILGSIYRNPSNPQGILLDGKPDPELNTEDDNPYLIVSGPQGGMIDVLVLDERLNHKLIRTSYVTEKSSASSSKPSSQILAGLWMKNLKGMERGTYSFWYYHYYPYPFTDQKVTEILQMIEHPVQVTAHPLP